MIDTAGSELGIIADDRSRLTEGDEVRLPDGSVAAVLEVYDDEAGRDGGVAATLVIED